jgi:hypothetical protein
MYIEIRLFVQLRRKYFSRLWSYIEVGIIVCSWTSVAIYIWRYRECAYIGRLFAETNGYVYINLQLAAYINDILTNLLGFSCFFGTIKCVRLCRFDRRLCLFVQTIEYAAKDLFSFTLMFSIVFLSFLSLFYLLFISQLWSCATLLQTAQMLFEMTLMKFDAQQLYEAAPFLGPFVFILFIILVVFVCMSMFLSIINEHFHRAKQGSHVDHQMIFSYMLDRFQRWTGRHRTLKRKPHIYSFCVYFRVETVNERRRSSEERCFNASTVFRSH